VSAWQRINLLNRVTLGALGGLCLLVAGAIWALMTMERTRVDALSTTAANVFLMTLIMAFIAAGVRRKINVYETFVEGAKEGFQTAVRIIPYLVAILVGIGVFRASGAMDWLTDWLGAGLQAMGLPADFGAALPTALMKPLSGSGARGLMVDAMATYGADSLTGRLACIFQGSTDTTFYILAVYFGSVGIRRTRHAVACGLLADAAGIVAAIGIGYLFFG
jgi:spore maturation protein SpmB